MTVFKQINFIKNNKIIFTVDNETLPNAVKKIKQDKKVDIFEDFSITVSCIYY